MLKKEKRGEHFVLTCGFDAPNRQHFSELSSRPSGHFSLQKIFLMVAFLMLVASVSCHKVKDEDVAYGLEDILGAFGGMGGIVKTVMGLIGRLGGG